MKQHNTDFRKDDERVTQSSRYCIALLDIHGEFFKRLLHGLAQFEFKDANFELTSTSARPISREIKRREFLKMFEDHVDEPTKIKLAYPVVSAP